MNSHLRRHINRINLRPRVLPAISEESWALIERMRDQVPQLTPPSGTVSPLLDPTCGSGTAPDKLSARA